MTAKELLMLTLPHMGSTSFDIEEFSQGAAFRAMEQNLDLLCRCPVEDCPEVLAYWREKGLIKQVHDKEDPANVWASYVPVEAEESAPSDKKYPLLFVLHGNGNSIYLAESYGYTHIAAREKLIVIIPENETEESIDRLYAFALEHFPVDASRVYMAGYSLGGMMTARNVLRSPERYAAAGQGGFLFAQGQMAEYPDKGILWPAASITPEMLQNAARVKIPVCCCLGEKEFTEWLPVTETVPRARETFQAAEGSISEAFEQSLSRIFRSEEKIVSVNAWREVAGCAPFDADTLKACTAEAQSEALGKLGLPLESFRTVQLDGETFFIGDSVDKNGGTLLRFICEAGLPHWPTQAFCEMTWAFMRRFYRDPETGAVCSIERSF